MAVPAVDNILGAMLVETCMACLLYGVTVIQAFLYYQTRTSAQDGIFIRLLVGGLWIVESVHTALCMHFAYVYTIQNFGNYDYIDSIHGGAATSILLAALIAAMTHSFFISRIWKTSNRSFALVIPLTVVSVCALACGVGAFVLSLTGGREWSAYRADISPYLTMTVGLACGVVVDLAIALILMYYLWSAKKNGEKPPLGDSGDTVLAYMVNTGNVTALAGVLALAFFIAQRHSLVFLGFIEIQTKLYSNSVLGTLNLRASASEKQPAGISTQLNMHKLTPRRSPARPHFRSHAPRAEHTMPQVTVIQETVVTRDDNDYDDSKYEIGLAIGDGSHDGQKTY